MRKVVIILLGVVSLALLAGVLWSHYGPLSDSDLKHITAIVRTKTTGSISKIERQRDGEVLVITQVENGINARTEFFKFRRTFFGWKIVLRGGGCNDHENAAQPSGSRQRPVGAPVRSPTPVAGRA